MICSSEYIGRKQDIVALFQETFAVSEGAEEGARIGDLAKALLETTPIKDIVVCVALDRATLVGCIVFTRLVFEQDDRCVYLLSLVAVHPGQQRKGVGQQLLRYGLDQLRKCGAQVAMTYGDPRYYSKVGFSGMSEDMARAPHKLSYPHGWLGQSLNGEDWTAFHGPSHCATALNDPAFW